MQISFLTGEYPPQPGGIGDYTRQLAAALAQRGHAPDVLTIQGARLVRYQPARSTPVATPHLRSTDWSLQCWPAVVAALAQERPAWLHIQYQTGAYAMQPGINLLPWRLRRLPERPQIAVTFHDLLEPYLFPKAGPLRRWVTLRLARDADAVIVTNSADAATLAAAGLQAQVIPIGSNIPVAPPPGYTRVAWRARLGIEPDELLVAYFGLLSASKGADLLVEAFRQATNRRWRLLIVGGAATTPQDRAYAEYFQSLLIQAGMEQRVIRTGHVTPAEVSAHLLAADCAALPFRDGASFRRGSLLAALAHGCPVTTTTPADADTRSALATEAVALTVPTNDSAALAAAIDRIANDPQLRARLATAGRALAARFSWDSIAAQHEACYGRS
jgi:glycosyltransferase involved in cell wall biosynthesis